jgi:hypothetical protein
LLYNFLALIIDGVVDYVILKMWSMEARMGEIRVIRLTVSQAEPHFTLFVSPIMWLQICQTCLYLLTSQVQSHMVEGYYYAFLSKLCGRMAMAKASPYRSPTSLKAIVRGRCLLVRLMADTYNPGTHLTLTLLHASIRTHIRIEL